MKFTEILEELKKGERVTREEWGEPDCTIDFIVYDQDKGKCMFYHDGNYYGYIFTYEVIIAEDWKIYHEKPTQSWKPQRGETYYSLDRCGRIFETNNVEYDTDKRAIRFGNCFKTKEEAQHMLQKIRIINQLQELSNIKFNENQKSKWCIFYDFDKNELTCIYNRYCKHSPFEVYFASKEDCQKAIETIGEDNLKKYYFDVED